MEKPALVPAYLHGQHGRLLTLLCRVVVAYIRYKVLWRTGRDFNRLKTAVEALERALDG